MGKVLEATGHADNDGEGVGGCFTGTGNAVPGDINMDDAAGGPNAFKQLKVGCNPMSRFWWGCVGEGPNVKFGDGGAIRRVAGCGGGGGGHIMGRPVSSVHWTPTSFLGGDKTSPCVLPPTKSNAEPAFDATVPLTGDDMDMERRFLGPGQVDAVRAGDNGEKWKWGEKESGDGLHFIGLGLLGDGKMRPLPPKQFIYRNHKEESYDHGKLYAYDYRWVEYFYEKYENCSIIWHYK